jgi:hypothetical protein
MKETSMKKSLLSLAVAAVLMSGVGLAQAQTTSATTVWTDAHSAAMQEHFKTGNYVGYTDKAMVLKEGMALPADVTIYPLPSTMKMDAGHYSYGMVNNNPVVVDSATRKVVHTWGPNGTGGGG